MIGVDVHVIHSEKTKSVSVVITEKKWFVLNAIKTLCMIEHKIVGLQEYLTQ